MSEKRFRPYLSELIDQLGFACASRFDVQSSPCGECERCEAIKTIDLADEVIADLVFALKSWQNYNMTLEQRQNLAMRAIAKAEGDYQRLEAIGNLP